MPIAEPIGEETPPSNAIVKSTIEFGEGELIGADVGKSAREQPAAEPAQQSAEREGDHLGAEDVDAVGAGGELVVADRAHRSAQPGVGRRQTK